MRHRLIMRLDDVAHFLYCPTMLGSRAARARWHHRVHLIPGFLLEPVCRAKERSLGVTDAEMYRTGEDVRRDAAREAAGGELEEEAREVESSSIRQMLSVRMEPDMVRDLRRSAEESGLTVSDLIRIAVVRLLAEETAEDVAALFDAGEKGLTAPPMRAMTCPDLCTRIEVGNGTLSAGMGACGEAMRPAPFSGAWSS